MRSRDDPRAFGRASGLEEARSSWLRRGFHEFSDRLCADPDPFFPGHRFRAAHHRRLSGGLRCGGQRAPARGRGSTPWTDTGSTIYSNLTFFLGRAGDTLDFVVLRDGEKVRLDGVEMPLQARTDEEGKTTYLRGHQRGAGDHPRHPGQQAAVQPGTTAMDFVRTGLDQPGRSGLRGGGTAGPVRPGGHRDHHAAQVGQPSLRRWGTRCYNILYLSALIASQPGGDESAAHPRAGRGTDSLSVAERPALSGCSAEEIDPKYEGYVHMAGLALLLTLSAGW